MLWWVTCNPSAQEAERRYPPKPSWLARLVVLASPVFKRETPPRYKGWRVEDTSWPPKNVCIHAFMHATHMQNQQKDEGFTVCRFLLRTVIIIQLLVLQPEEAKDTECPASKLQAVQFQSHSLPSFPGGYAGLHPCYTPDQDGFSLLPANASVKGHSALLCVRRGPLLSGSGLTR